MTTKFYREAKCFNPFMFNGLQVHSFIIYNEGKVILSTKWFSDSNNNFESIVIESEIKKAMKVNLNRKDCYYVKSDENYVKSYDVYINTQFIEVKSLGVSEGVKCWYHTETHETFEIVLNGVKYIPQLDEMKKLIYVTKEGSHTITLKSNYHFEKTDEMKKCESLAKNLSNIIGREVSSYDVHEVLNHYDITPKNK